MEITKELLYTEIIQQRKTFKQLADEIKTSAVTICKYFKQFDLYSDPLYIPQCSGKARSKFIQNNITPEILKDLYINQNLSALEIAEYFSEKINTVIYASTILSLCKQYGIKTKSIKDVANTERCRQKCKTTCSIRFGVDNVSKDSSIKKKKEDTCFQHYGVTSPSFVSSLMQQAKQTKIDRYGTACLTNLYGNCSGRRSKPHIQVEEYLQSKGIAFISEDNKTFLREGYGAIPDICIHEQQIIFEIYGDFWHANPNKHKKDEIIPTWFGLMTAEELWFKDEKRRKYLESFGYTVYIIWEDDIVQNRHIRIIEDALNISK